MSDEGLEKQHHASARRLEELRKKGQTLRSRDLTTGLSFVAALAIVVYMSSYFVNQFQSNFVLSFTSIKDVMAYDEVPRTFLMKIALGNFVLLLPIFLIAIITSLLSLFLFGGWNFTLQTLQFNFSKMNPIQNLQNIFSINLLINIAKSVIKVIIIISVLVLFSFNKMNLIAGLIHLPLDHSLGLVAEIVKGFMGAIVAALVVIVAIDLLQQFFQFQHKTKMTTQEVKDEHKETEGNTEVKRKLRSTQFTLLKQRLNILVPRANVIITNPTHYAVAIRYEEGKDYAPKVIAKGKGFIAQQIKLLAASNSVPVYEAPVLARAIFHTTRLGAEINPGLYMSVAIVLSYVNQLKNYQKGYAQKPMYVTDLKVPKEFIYSE